jgi:hypothetical protein
VLKTLQATTGTIRKSWRPNTEIRKRMQGSSLESLPSSHFEPRVALRQNFNHFKHFRCESVAIASESLTSQPIHLCKRRSCLDDSQLTGADGRLCAVPHVELGEDVRDVVLDGALGKAETIRNLLVRRTGPKERQDVTLAD